MKEVDESFKAWCILVVSQMQLPLNQWIIIATGKYWQDKYSSGMSPLEAIKEMNKDYKLVGRKG